MNYTKPEVAVLGAASMLIEHLTTKKNSFIDGNGTGQLNAVAPAYDLDE
jgi:hypothetical protein